MSTLLTLEQARELTINHGAPAAPLVVLGLRKNSSTYGKYDDIIALLIGDTYTEYEGNTLPSVDRAEVAVLQPGCYDYHIGLHGVSHLRRDAKGELIPPDNTINQWLEDNLTKGLDYPSVVKDADGNVRLLPYPALRQDGPVLIKRIGHTVAVVDGWPNNPAWIDIHKGGRNLTSSLGCQTLHPDHWEEFRKLVYSTVDTKGIKSFKYVLVQQ